MESHVYEQFEYYIGGSRALHSTLSFLIAYMAVLAFPSMCKAISNDISNDIFAIRLLVLLLFIVSLDELSQLFLSHRTFSTSDMMTNWFGITTGYFLARLYLFKFKPLLKQH
ncbi:VanZ family protein [Vibrio vulnificus]|nr:VanZ family protein [Vibrio vulnificus]